MKKIKLEYLFIPATAYLWYLATYYGMYLAILAILMIMNLSWIVLIVGFTILMGISFVMSNSLGMTLRWALYKFYGTNRIIIGVHGIAGAIGVIKICISVFTADISSITAADSELHLIPYLWQLSPLKLVFMALPFLGILLSVAWSSTFGTLISMQED